MLIMYRQDSIDHNDVSDCCWDGRLRFHPAHVDKNEPKEGECYSGLG